MACQPVHAMKLIALATESADISSDVISLIASNIKWVLRTVKRRNARFSRITEEADSGLKSRNNNIPSKGEDGEGAVSPRRGL